MYYFNKMLFDNLADVLGVTKKDVSNRVFGNDYQYFRRINDPGNLRLTELVAMCNTFRIPLSRFVSNSEPENVSREPSQYVIGEYGYLPIVFHPGHLKRIYGKNGFVPGLTRKEFCKSVGISESGFMLWANPEDSKIPVNSILEMCNLYKLDLSHFVEDPNEGIPPVETETDAGTFSRLAEELAELREIVAKNKKEIESLKRENASLKLANREYLAAEADVDYGSGAKNKREWTFDAKLLQSLPGIIGVSKKELLNPEEGMSTYYESFNEKIPVTNFVDICNRYHISTRYFLRRDGGERNPVQDYSHYRTEDWKPVTFHPAYVTGLFGRDSLTGMKKQDIIRMGAATEGDFKGWKKANSTMRMNDLVRLCNLLDITPSCFITDSNCPELGYPVTTNELLLEENRLLRLQMLKMKREMKDKKQE